MPSSFSTSSSSRLYANIRDSMESGDGPNKTIQARVEVNQRALIDKILARYASANAVYRELLQNSNDANATKSEIYFDVSTGETGNNGSNGNGSNNQIVTEVRYRNNGMPFRPQDWTRLSKIAEGNPDPQKVGAFGVGAYSMFSICEEPMVISGTQALCFCWKGDALWSKVIHHATAENDPSEWTTFVLPSRDPYALPDLVEFGQFLCANLTFTQCLRDVSLFVNHQLRLRITKTTIQEPILVQTPKASSWWKSDGAVTATNLFSLQSGHIYESRQQISVTMPGTASSTITARYVSGKAKTNIPSDLARRMERVTKKEPPPHVMVQVVLAEQTEDALDGRKKMTDAEQITASFSPQLGGRGRVFIGFRTSQTTGLAAHLQAPLIPTVEREAIDLQDATLKVYNSELLEICGIVLRLTLEHAMVQIGQEYLKNREERDALETRLLAQMEQEQKKNNPTDAEPSEDNEEEEPPPTTAKSSILSFAKYMAKGVKKQLVSVITTAGTLLDDGSESLLNPRDPLPLSPEERLAISLMQAFCPQQSTPDAQVGAALAQGFSNCLPLYTPPVLTKLGVSREGKLPNLGMEQFVPQSHVIRKVVYQNAQEYHDVLCQCRKLTMDDLLAALKSQVFDQDKAIRVARWWTKFIARDPRYAARTIAVKDSIRFYDPKDGTRVDSFANYIYHVSNNASLKDLPLPNTVLTKELQDGIITLPKGWFVDLQVDVWVDFIVQHPCMTQAQPEDEQMRLKVLALLCKEWRNKPNYEKPAFGYKLKTLLQDRPCLPFDSSEPTQLAAERPGNLYLNSAELKAFAGLGNSFQKVSQSVHSSAGVTDDFLILLGVRKSVAIDFLFAHLDTLQWSDDPKPLVEYLRSASLTNDDLKKLQTTQYLPAENDTSRMFATRELHLPTSELRLFPFVKILQWPSDDELTHNSANGRFLVKLGMKTNPDLMPLLTYISSDVKDDQLRVRCLDYVAKNLGAGGTYERGYQLIRASALSSLKIIPCLVQDLLNPPAAPSQIKQELQSPLHCYSDPGCLVLGFSVVDPKYEKNGFASRFRVPHEPDADLVISKLMHLVSSAKASSIQTKKLLEAFDKIFAYLSHRSTDFSTTTMNSLKNEKFIPCAVNDDNSIEWFAPDGVYFKKNDAEADSLTESLFHVIDFSPFLSAAGVKAEATTGDLFRLMIEDPESLLGKLGSEEKYRALLRRIASNPPFRRVTPDIQNRPFLLAYEITQDEEAEDGKEKRRYLLAKAVDIYLIDNSYFGRMFPVLRAPHESDLEAFYGMLGSPYISKSVNKSFQVIGNASAGTTLASQLSQRLEERRPLLVSPSVTSRPLVTNASKAIDASNLKLFEVDNLKAVYSLGKSVRNQRVTCCAKTLAAGKNGLYVTSDFDWFDVGYAIGGLILQRCQLEDAFFIGSLLEAPLEQLKSRGFPVDRILVAPPEAATKPPPPAIPPAVATTGSSESVMNPKAASPPSSGGHQGTDSSDSTKNPDIDRANGVAEILRQMFPDCDVDYLRKRLGVNPSMDTVRSLAEEMAEKGYPKQETSKDEDAKKDQESFLPPDIANPDKQKKLGRRIGKALSGIRNNVGNMAPIVGNSGGRIRSAAPPPAGGVLNDGNPVPPAVDSSGLSNMEEMLQNTVKESAKVNAKGITSPESVMTQLPEGMDRPNEGCEVLPGHSLKPFNGPYRSGKTHNGVRVFSARIHPSSEIFLTENFHAVDSFADVLQNLCGIYQLNLSSIAIFHDPTGGTIAFNANRALHFNVRFFFALHYGTNLGSNRASYSYWFTTMAHELAHHLVSAHNKEHGYYTESYVTLYIPKLVSLLTQLEAKSDAAKRAAPARSKFV